MNDPNTVLSWTTNRPRAIAKEKDGVVLYWVEELGVAGLHQRGLASLLGHDPGSLGKLVKGVEGLNFLKAEIITEHGLRSVDLILESDLSEVLVEIVSSKTKHETRDRAKDILKKLAAAGFKLMVMMELAPAELAARAVSHLEQQIELERLKNQGRELEAQKAAIEDRMLSFRHLVVTTMPEPIQQKVLGYQVVEKVEYRDRVIKDSQVIDEGNTINKSEICKRYGILTRNGKPDYKRLNAYFEGLKLPNAAWEETMVVQHNQQLRVEYLPQLEQFLFSGDRQIWLGES